MRAITVCVDYSDFLGLTLPLNRYHFEQFSVVTSSVDVITQNLARTLGANVIVTDCFYDDGARFNKAKALEHGLDVIGRHGWLCLMDADVIWPNELPDFARTVGNIYVPNRRMMRQVEKAIPDESDWSQYPLNPYKEFSGYSQIFHASDTTLGPAPWHQIIWKHAGGADTCFSQKWPKVRRIRPPFEVLHLGENQKNWWGRVSDFLDGTSPEKKIENDHAMKTMMKRRASHKRRYEGERI